MHIFSEFTKSCLNGLLICLKLIILNVLCLTICDEGQENETAVEPLLLMDSSEMINLFLAFRFGGIRVNKCSYRPTLLDTLDRLRSASIRL
ncbi:hypothetical protein NPIL_184581 [Nephila pilipes]|uniref:Uncharacterized protein n=1 Tax=Nephila pilipes TaxID=299642 RepID=A0A8X6QUD0_NEPPI|nr:hypothetical protein NPIL_184581 [Nephila pilipes]